ncbi:MAG: histidine kinase [Burkholderiales bacterium]|nr:histidine kinase [Burkholderiales bacterium]
MASISQNPRADGLPDFRNLGVIARILVAVNVLALAAALAAHAELAAAAGAFVRWAALVEPALLASLLALWIAAPRLQRLPYPAASAAALALVALAVTLAHAALGAVAETELARALAFALGAGALLLAWLRLRERAFSPALAEARLAALQARIRPHFLFNSLNAALGLLRRDPRRAEQVIEDLAELFRALLSDARAFVRLADEIALAERYAAIEQLRLGERLRLVWELDAAPVDALVPPLVLQPLRRERGLPWGRARRGHGRGAGAHRAARRPRARARRKHARSGAGRGRRRRRATAAAWRSTTSASGSRSSTTPRRSLATAAANGRYRVEIDLPYRVEAS